MSSKADSIPSPRSSAGFTDGGTDRRAGFALLLVIWVLAILAVLAVGLAATMRSETRLARNLVGGAQARALAEAGVARAEASLLDPDPAARWPADGTPQSLAFGGGTIRIRIEDEGGKVDLNLAPPELLSGLCHGVGVDAGVCSALVEGVMARRHTQPFAPGAGASAARQQTDAFSTVEELRQLPGVDPSSLDRLRPFLTVYSRTPRIDPMTASRDVLLAIPGINPGEVERLLAARATSSQAPTAIPPMLSGVELYVGRGQLHAATIIAEATTESGASFTRRAVIALTGIPLRPVQVLEWNQEIAAAPSGS